MYSTLQLMICTLADDATHTQQMIYAEYCFFFFFFGLTIEKGTIAEGL